MIRFILLVIIFFYYEKSHVKAIRSLKDFERMKWIQEIDDKIKVSSISLKLIELKLIKTRFLSG